MRPSPARPLARYLKLALAAVQVFDIALHVATGQAEPLRVAANLIMLAWLAAPATGRWLSQARPLAIAALTLYLSFNIIFLTTAGLTNPAAGGAPRVTLFVLIAVTTVLAMVVMYLRRKPKA